MAPKQVSSIKSWIKSMGFKLEGSHTLKSSSKKIKYYILDNFGVYEEIPLRKTDGKASISEKNKKFISWTPWGERFEINSVRDLSGAYQEFLKYNPDVRLEY
ncbi:MAG: hypothetical protein K0S09_2588 [Sphingobacteriaceae bacterium]|jgi:hypothetical protein|nr:hypothetical protein [Sphingobacteriaceae bacterium]